MNDRFVLEYDIHMNTIENYDYFSSVQQNSSYLPERVNLKQATQIINYCFKGYVYVLLN